MFTCRKHRVSMTHYKCHELCRYHLSPVCLLRVTCCARNQQSDIQFCCTFVSVWWERKEFGGRTTYNITGLPSLLIGLQPCEEDWSSLSYTGESGGMGSVRLCANVSVSVCGIAHRKRLYALSRDPVVHVETRCLSGNAHEWVGSGGRRGRQCFGRVVSGGEGALRGLPPKMEQHR